MNLPPPSLRTLPTAQANYWVAGLLAGLLLLLAVIYLRALDAPFVFDSVKAIRDNAELSQQLIQSGPRWVAQTSFALDRRMYGEWLGGFHLSSILVHLLSFCFLATFAYQTVKLSTSRTVAEQNIALILAPCVIWAVHPIQVQAVIYTVQRHETLMSMFFLAAASCFAIALQSRHAWRWLLGSAVAFAAATGCKEVSIAFPPVIALYDYVFSPRDNAASTWRWWLDLLRQRGWYYLLLGGIAIYGLMPSLSVIVDRLERQRTAATAAAQIATDQSAGDGPATSVESTPREIADAVTVPGVTPRSYLLSQTKVIVRYLGLLCFPRGQSLDHVWEISRGAFDLSFYPLVLGLAAVAGLWLTWRRSPFGWLAVSFLLILAPTSSILPIRDLMVEHRLYLPSACFWGVVWLLLIRLVARPQWLLLLGVSLAVAYAIPAAMRAQVFRTTIGLWQDVLEKQPDNPEALLGIGQGEYEAGRYEDSIRTLERGVRAAEQSKRIPALISPEEMRMELSKVQNNLAVILTRRKELARARQLLESAIANCPENPAAHASLGNVLAYQGEIEAAAKSYRRALELDPSLDSARINLDLITPASRER